jgi:hypothetical protein
MVFLTLRFVNENLPFIVQFFLLVTNEHLRRFAPATRCFSPASLTKFN